MTDDETHAWLLSAACEDECRDRLAGDRECRDVCDRWLRACEALRKATPDRRAGFVTRRRAARQRSENESLQ